MSGEEFGVDLAIGASPAELTDRELLESTILDHLRELDIEGLRSIGRDIAAIARGRALFGPTSNESEADLRDLVAYLSFELATRRGRR